MSSSDIPQRPLPDAEALRNFYVGKDISEVPKPAAILDVAKIRRHCSSMLETVKTLGVEFRPHVKTHKTAEVACLQVGDTSPRVNIVFSTLPELELLVPLLNEVQRQTVPSGADGTQVNRQVDALYGIPLPPSQVPRLASIGRRLGKARVSVMVDHASQLDAVTRLGNELGYAPGVFLKIDTGYHRAGLPPNGLQKGGLIQRLTELHDLGQLLFHGLYSHSSLSYNDSTPEAALLNLEAEIVGCESALKEISTISSGEKVRGDALMISVGATPQIVAAYHLCSEKDVNSEAVKRLEATLSRHKGKLEFHAGVYSILDMQQLTTNAKAKAEEYQKEIAITVTAEVVSLYNDNEREQPEALLAVGALGLGREPCAHYKGWGVVKEPKPFKERQLGRRLVVNRVSQEHSIVSWECDKETEKTTDLPPIPLEVGQVVEIFPNHACITGAMYSWYLVVDSDQDQDGSRITDVWVRTGGW